MQMEAEVPHPLHTPFPSNLALLLAHALTPTLSAKDLQGSPLVRLLGVNRLKLPFLCFWLQETSELQHVEEYVQVLLSSHGPCSVGLLYGGQRGQYWEQVGLGNDSRRPGIGA